MTDRKKRDAERRARREAAEEEERRREEWEQRDRELREAWRRHHPSEEEGEKGRPARLSYRKENFSGLVWPPLEASPDEATYDHRARVRTVLKAISKGAADMAWSMRYKVDYGLT